MLKQTNVSYLVVFLSMLVSTSIVSTCVTKSPFSLRIGEPGQKIFVELNEIESENRYSVYTINFENKRNWGPVGGGFLQTCSIRKMAESRGYKWYAVSHDFKGNDNHTLVVYLNRKEEDVKKVLLAERVIKKEEPVEISHIKALNDPTDTIKGKNFYDDLCKKMLSTAEISY